MFLEISTHSSQRLCNNHTYENRKSYTSPLRPLKDVPNRIVMVVFYWHVNPIQKFLGSA